MRARFLLAAVLSPCVLAAQRGDNPTPASVTIPALKTTATPDGVRALLTALAHDSLEGRAVWSRGSDKAAKIIADQMKKIGLVPAGDSGYFQKIPGVANATGRVVRLPSLKDLDTVPVERRRMAVNVVGILPGKAGYPGPDSIVLIDAHYDHVGMRCPGGRRGAPPPTTPTTPTPCTDSIYNGADDDASGTVAVLEIARILKATTQPRRTVVFLATTGEESGLVGTRWYLANPIRPLSTMAANLEIEMIGRPDSLAGGRGRGWLTGFERSTMGPMFEKSGLAIVPDKRPSQGFFERSDNIAFATAGIPAHTLSTFNLHTDYHQVSDDVSKVDFDHMAALINIGAKAALVLTEGPAPQWVPGGRPCPRGQTSC